MSLPINKLSQANSPAVNNPQQEAGPRGDGDADVLESGHRRGFAKHGLHGRANAFQGKSGAAPTQQIALPGPNIIIYPAESNLERKAATFPAAPVALVGDSSQSEVILPYTIPGHHYTAYGPDLHVSGDKSIALRPQITKEADEVHVIPGKVHDNRQGIAVGLTDYEVIGSQPAPIGKAAPSKGYPAAPAQGPGKAPAPAPTPEQGLPTPPPRKDAPGKAPAPAPTPEQGLPTPPPRKDGPGKGGPSVPGSDPKDPSFPGTPAPAPTPEPVPEPGAGTPGEPVKVGDQDPPSAAAPQNPQAVERPIVTDEPAKKKLLGGLFDSHL